MAGRYVMTARRKAALRKAQIASARKRRKGAKTREYGASRKTATASQRNNRRIRAVNRARVAYVGVYAGAVGGMYAYQAATLRKANSKIAYDGVYTDKTGRSFNAQGGPRVLRVKPTAAGARRRNRADFRKQNGGKALRQLKKNMKRTQRTQRRNVSNAVRYGGTTMSWGPRQQSLGRGR